MTTDVEPPPPPPASTPEPFPLYLEIRHPEHQRRLTNIPVLGTLFRYVLVLPMFPFLAIFGYLSLVSYLASSCVILATGKYPHGLFKIIVGVMRWQLNVQAYEVHLFDDYPPADLDPRRDWWVEFGVAYPDHPSRFLNSPVLGLLIKEILAIPHILVLYFLGVLTLVMVLIANVAILFSGKFPLGMHRFVVGVLRWQYRVSAYIFGLTDRYPPFSLAS